MLATQCSYTNISTSVEKISGNQVAWWPYPTDTSKITLNLKSLAKMR